MTSASTARASRRAAVAPVETVSLVSTQERAEAPRARLDADADQQGAAGPNARAVVEGRDEAAIALRVINEIVPADHNG